MYGTTYPSASDLVAMLCVCHATPYNQNIAVRSWHLLNVWYTLVYHTGTVWWRHHMETFSAFLAICARNSPVTGKFPSQRPVTRSFDIFFDQCLNKRWSKQSGGWWFKTPSRPLWRHCNGNRTFYWAISFGAQVVLKSVILTICQHWVR